MEGNRTLLLVDNDDDFRATRREVLERAGFEVLEAATVVEATKIANSYALDLAMVDVRLQHEELEDWSGLYLARELSAQVPILLMSSFSENLVKVAREKMLPEFDEAAVAVGFHTKQDGPTQMLEIITDLLEMPLGGLAQSGNRGRQAVFLSYGHDQAARDVVRDFLISNGLKVLELGRSAQYGDTILGNFERYVAQARFAVVLFTADDEGFALRDGSSKTKKRPRQNVVFELGYLLSKMGRRVRVLVVDGLELPTNYLGLLYIPFDSQHAWKATLAREMRHSGININLKNVLDALNKRAGL